MPQPKPLRPGDNCPVCGSLLFPHCPDKKWPIGCDWVKCRACGSFGTVEHGVLGTSDAALEDPEPSPDPE